jgi:putative ABC transport system permease protein
VVDEFNRLSTTLLAQVGLADATYSASEFIGQTFLKVIDNDDFYVKDGELFSAPSTSQYASLYDEAHGVELRVVGVLRIKEDAASAYFSEGFVYTSALTDHVVASAQESEIARAQKGMDKDCLTGLPFANDDARKAQLLRLGADTTATAISIYPIDFAAKDEIKAYLDEYNADKAEQDQVIYSDMAEMISQMTGTLLSTVSYVLIGFAGVSLLVSTIMIGIIIYVSVVERTKEIGILRSVGARKKDITRVFNAEAMIIGLVAGLLGVGLSYVLAIPINMVISHLAGLSGIAALNPVHALALVAGSILLTLIASFFPARIASRKDPVVALRTE